MPQYNQNYITTQQLIKQFHIQKKCLSLHELTYLDYMEVHLIIQYANVNHNANILLSKIMINKLSKIIHQVHILYLTAIFQCPKYTHL